jgi:D-alanine-D-alanine ligase
VRAIAQDIDIPVPSEIWIDPSNSSTAIPSHFPAIMKPAYGDSSVGITQNAVVYSAEDVVSYFEQIKASMPATPILVQEFLEGAEYSVGIVGNDFSMEVLPILEVDYSGLPPELPRILGYESKWLPDSPYWTSIKYKQAELNEHQIRDLAEHSIALFNRLNCRDYARFDYRMNANGEIKLLEVNPNPGWCWDGKMALMASFGGISYHELLEKIIKAAMDRYSL